jgi:hypothetical protein
VAKFDRWSVGYGEGVTVGVLDGIGVSVGRGVPVAREAGVGVSVAVGAAVSVAALSVNTCGTRVLRKSVGSRPGGGGVTTTGVEVLAAVQAETRQNKAQGIRRKAQFAGRMESKDFIGCMEIELEP